MKKQGAISGNLFDLKILARLYDFVKPHRFKFYIILLLTVLSAFLGPAIPILIGYTIDHQIRLGDGQGLLQMVILLIVILMAHAIVQYYHTYLSGWLGQSVVKDIRIKLYNHLLKFRLKYFDKTPIGQLVTRNISDIETLSNVFTEGLAAIAGDVLQLVVILVAMFVINWKLTFYSLSMLPLLLLSTYIFKEKIKGSFNEVRMAVANLNTFVQEHITGMSIVQIFNSEKKEYEKFKQINDVHKKSNLKSVLYYSIYFPVAELMSAIGTGLLVWYGAKGVLDDHVTVGNLIAFITLIAMFFRPIRMIADRFNTLQMGIVSSERILTLIENKEDLTLQGNYKPETFKGEVKFENVWFAYNDQDFVLKDISFEARQGETIAFVGATGAGKSSIINLLNRFYEINSGNIKIDGVDIKDYDLDHLRGRISVVLQDVFLFSGSIANNITLNNPLITEEKMWEAAKLVGAQKFIEKLPGGFQYNVMERGATLSAGQRQLISFIRSIVYDPKIIVLDEATSSIDTETEEMIQNAIEKLMQGRTAIVIAHRLSTIQKAKRIYVLDKGEIREVGSHQELLDKNGLYANLNDLQYKKH